MCRRSCLVVGLTLLAAASCGAQAGDPTNPGVTQPLRVAVYEAAPYGSVGGDGLFSGASVDLWRRVAEERHWQYRLEQVSAMHDVLAGVERGTIDVAIGAITITPERLARVDFTYPTHRSGVAVVFAKQTGLASVLATYGTVASQLGALLVIMLAMLLVIGSLIWLFERRKPATDAASESAIGSFHEGLYWAVVTMTTVGYGDKTPKTHVGRAIAVVWMLASLALVSLLSTSLVAQLTAERIVGTESVRQSDLVGKRVAAVEGSSGAEYLASEGLAFAKYPSLNGALDALARGHVDAVVNSVGALEHAVSTRYAAGIDLPHGLLAPALMGFALPPRSALKGQLDQSLVKITTGSEWPAIEARYFGR